MQRKKVKSKELRFSKSLSILLKRELVSFRHLLPKLLPAHEGHYVALYGGKVIDHDSDEFVLAERVSQRSLPHAVLVKRVVAKPLKHLPARSHSHA